MDLKCSTCKTTLHESSGNSLNLVFPELKTKLILIVQDFLHGSTLKFQDFDVICDECKDGFVSFYKFKIKTTKILEEQNDSLTEKENVDKSNENPIETDTKPNLKRSNSAEALSQVQKKLKPNSSEEAPKQDLKIKYKFRCLTCNKGLEEQSANHMNLAFPNMRAKLKDMIEKCLSIKVQDCRVICDGCKDGFLSSYKFNMKAKKTVVERKNKKSKQFKVIVECPYCGEEPESEEEDFEYYHVMKYHKDEVNNDDDRDEHVDYIY